MPDDRTHAHPLLQQTPLSVNPFIDLPKPPTLPHTYASLPSTLPPSSINAAPSPSNPKLPAYVTSGSSGFAAHPNTILAQNRALLRQLDSRAREGREKVEEWEHGIRERELAEKRRKAPGWLDGEVRLLEPEKKNGKSAGVVDLMDEVETAQREMIEDGGQMMMNKKVRDVDDLGEAMDRAFGRSEMG